MLVFSLIRCLPTSSNFISNTLKTGCVTHCITQITRDKIFFNRKQELAKFKKVFNSDSELHVILGPPSTGKTVLICELTSKGDFSPLFINCRKGQFNSSNRIYNSITSEFEKIFTKYTNQFKELFKQKKVNYTMNDIPLKIRSFGKDPFSEITFNDVNKLLIDIGKALPNQICWSDYNIPPPILIINEADMIFSQITVLEERKVLLKLILNWMVNIKEEKHFHVVLTSSNSFFLTGL
jgi:hypothetical protein